MRAHLPALLAFGLLFGSAITSRAEEEPRKIIERAIQARGKDVDSPEVNAIWHKVKGRYHFPSGYRFILQRYAQGEKSRYTYDIDFDGSKALYLGVSDGDNLWLQLNGNSYDPGEGWLKQQRRSRYVDRITSLRSVLTDKSFSLAGLPEEQVEGQPAVGVKVTAKDRPDVLLYFDKVSGLLVKSQCRDHDDFERRQVTSAVVYLDYRTVDPVAADEQALKAAKLPSDSPALLDLIRKQIVTEADRKKLEELIRQLGDDSFQKREKASAELVSRGAAAVSFLRQAVNSADLEVARRARDCLERIKETANNPVMTAAVRLLSVRKPGGAAEALLAYLPFAADEEMARETQAALVALAVRDGKPDPVLLRALEDKDPKRRAAAAAALGKDGGAYQKQPGRRILLTDLKRPTKLVYYRDGKKSMESEELEVRFYNKLDDKLFAKP